MANLRRSIEYILNQLSTRLLSAKEVATILGDPEEYPTELVESISLETAVKYWNGEMSYEAGDFIMNNLYAFWSLNDCYFEKYSFSEDAWQCFEAFDTGEYVRKGDAPEINLAEKYTKPLIEVFLRRKNIIA